MFTNEDRRISREEYRRICGYPYYNYASIMGQGAAYIFNFLRYNMAFLTRQQDVDAIVEALHRNHFLYHPYIILLGKYDWRKSPGWHHEILNSDQTLHEQSPGERPHRLPKKLVWEHRWSMLGQLPEILQMMLDERATLYDEPSVHIIYDAFFKPDQTIQVELVNFLPVKPGRTLTI